MPTVPPYRYSIGFFVILPGVPGQPGTFMPGDFDVELDVPISGPVTKNQVREKIMNSLAAEGVLANGVNIISWNRYENPGPRSGTEIPS
jgi:hypothetical protein